MNDYPIVEAIASILPVVDLMIVAVGESEDDTLKLIENIPPIRSASSKLFGIPKARKGGEILAIETNNAFDQVSGRL